MKRENRLKWILITAIFIFAAIVMLPYNQVKAETKTVKAGIYETVAVFDMKSAGCKDIKLTTSDKLVRLNMKTYKIGSVKHTVVLAHNRNVGNDQSATITINYYDIAKKKTNTVIVNINFLKDYNHGYSSDMIMKKGQTKSFKVENKAEIKLYYSMFTEYNSAIFSCNISEDGITCSTKTNVKKKNFSITANHYGMAEVAVTVSFKNGESYWYKFNTTVARKDGSIASAERKIVKGESIILYFMPPENGELSVKVGDKTIVSSEIMQDKKLYAATLKLKGLKTGKTNVLLTCKDNGKSYTNRYEISVIAKSPIKRTVKLTPKEVGHSFGCKYTVTDICGNPITGSDYEVISADSSQVYRISADNGDIGISAAGTYKVNVTIKNLDGSIVQNYSLTITVGELKYSDYEKITFATQKEAKDFFCASSRRSWDYNCASITMTNKDTFDAIDDSEPWFIRYGDYADGEATYSIDIKRKVIIVEDYEQTLEIPYEIISKHHIRLTIKGTTYDFTS